MHRAKFRYQTLFLSQHGNTESLVTTYTYAIKKSHNKKTMTLVNNEARQILFFPIHTWYSLF